MSFLKLINSDTFTDEILGFTAFCVLYRLKPLAWILSNYTRHPVDVLLIYLLNKPKLSILSILQYELSIIPATLLKEIRNNLYYFHSINPIINEEFHPQHRFTELTKLGKAIDIILRRHPFLLFSDYFHLLIPEEVFFYDSFFSKIWINIKWVYFDTFSSFISASILLFTSCHYSRTKTSYLLHASKNLHNILKKDKSYLDVSVGM